MIFVVQALVSTQSHAAARALAVATLIWTIVGAPGTAVADACAYASAGPGGTEAVAVAGHVTWTDPPFCSPPPPSPTPTPTPPPPP
ncbi:proline-rich protein, partial [Streptomyces sp. XY152]